MLYRQIILEWGQDTESGVWGLGYSPDNGKNFYVLNTTHGRKYRAEDGNRLYPYISDQIQDKIDTVVAPAKSAADSAQSAADAAVASAQVTSDAVSAIASATAEAKQGANDAMSRAKSAWDVATSAKEAVTEFDPLLKSAQSDADKALIQIADTASALSDAKTAFDSDVAAAKELASTAQTTADSAVKSASSVADDLAAVANQAKANANGITKVTSDVGLLQTTVANNSGNISTIQETAKQIQQAVSDNAGNIMVATQTADSAVAVASDARSNATVAIQTASQASITAINASGQAASAVLTANGAMTTASNAKSDATVAIQTASGASLTATNAKDDATVAKQTASEATVQASNAESDFAQISIRANKIEANVANNSGAIASVQQTANGLITTVADIKANGGGVNLLVGSDPTLNNRPILYGVTEVSVDGVKAWESNNSDGIFFGSILEANTTYTYSALIKADTAGELGFLCYGHFQVYNSNAHNKVDPLHVDIVEKRDYHGITVPANQWTKICYTFTTNDLAGSSFNVFPSHVNGHVYTRHLMLEKGVVAHDWSPAPDDLQNQFTQIKTSINGVTTTINDPKTGLNATYQTAAGNATTISSVKGDVTQLQATANGLTSRVGSLESKTDTQQTAIEQNKNAIALKAAQTDVDTLKGNVTDLQAEITTQANEIKSKVTQSDVTGMLTDYATQSYTQSLVTQKANDWNLNLTRLQTEVNAIDVTGGGVNLQSGTSDDSGAKSWTSTTYTLYDQFRFNFDKGKTYTFSYDVICNTTPPKNLTVGVDIFAPTGGSDWTSSSGFWDLHTVNQGTTHVESTFTITDNWTKWGIWRKPNADKTSLTITNVKLERGSVATPYSPAPSDMATVTSVTSLSATVDGIQAQVYNSDGSSKITQLSNLIAAKVSQGDYNSQITQLQNNINLRVAKGDLISQINQEAGGNTLIQVSNGKGSLILDAANTIITGEAWIPGAAIGSLDASKLTFYGANNTYATIGASVAQYDDDNQKSTINLQYNGGIEIHSSNQQGSILTMHDNTIRLASKSWGDNPNAYQYSGFYAAPNYSLMNTYHKDGTTSGVAIDDDRIHIYGSSKDNQLGALQADVGWYSINGKTGLLTGNQISLKAGNTQAVLNDNNININNASDTNSKNYDVAIHIKGWAEMTGWFTCMGITQTSLLSTKTRIEPLDTKVALDKIASTNVETYQFKSDVAKGKTKRHASVIIDDVNDVAEYYTPEEFISENRMGRDDGDIIGYLMGAVQELKKQLDELKEKI